MSISQKSILLLEDSSTDLELIIYELQKDLEFDYRHVATQEDFEYELEEYKPDIVVSDYNLPGYSGLEALQYVNGNYSLLPFILVSGSINKEIERKILEHKADDVILKHNLTRLPFAIKRSLAKAEDKRDMERNLKERETLLSEVHHRVKNNLAIISAFAELKKFETEDDAFEEFLSEILMKIKSIALVHEILYRDHSFTSINFNRFLDELIIYYKNIFSGRKSNIKISKNDFNLYLNINQAVPSGLIVTELVNNAFKYAYINQTSGLLDIKVENRDRKVIISVTDNGIGLPDEFEAMSESSYGMNIIHALVKQLQGSIEYRSSNDGTKALFTFTKEKGSKGSSSAFL
jgi:two-component sensor histidine kinase